MIFNSNITSFCKNLQVCSTIEGSTMAQCESMIHIDNHCFQAEITIFT
jgi:hypothetical protein